MSEEISESEAMSLNFDDDEETNRRAFIGRLINAGWSKRDAAREWDRIQEDNESEL